MAFLWFQVGYARDLFGKWGERGVHQWKNEGWVRLRNIIEKL
jgi:hypothetical protein